MAPGFIRASIDATTLVRLGRRRVAADLLQGDGHRVLPVPDRPGTGHRASCALAADPQLRGGLERRRCSSSFPTATTAIAAGNMIANTVQIADPDRRRRRAPGVTPPPTIAVCAPAAVRRRRRRHLRLHRRAADLYRRRGTADRSRNIRHFARGDLSLRRRDESQVVSITYHLCDRRQLRART